MRATDDRGFRRRRGASPAVFGALLIGLVVLAASAWGAEPAGRIISSAGSIEATDADGLTRQLGHGDSVYPGETLTLGSGAHAQLRMRDDALLELEEATEFAIDRYAERDDGGHVLMRLLRGAMRTITGTIGESERDDYRVDTPVAAIGIRGTQYALHLCGDACESEDRPGGLYGRVDQGAVAASNDAASRVFERNEYFYVADSDLPPREIVRPPDGILDGGAVSRGDVGSDSGPLAGSDVLIDETSGSLGDTVEDLGSSTDDPIGSLADGTGDAIESLGDGDAGGAVDSLSEGTEDAVDDLTDGTEDALEDASDGLEELL